MVAGDLVNTAAPAPVGRPARARSSSARRPQRAASAAIVFEPAGEQTLKGKTAPVPAWRALRVVAERGGRNRAETLEAPFVGRDDELRLLKDLFHATVRERGPASSRSPGPAGIGKTPPRLGVPQVRRRARRADLLARGPLPRVRRGDHVLGARRDGPRAGPASSRPTTRRRRARKIAETVAAHVPDADERRWIEPALLALLGIETSAVGPEQLFAAWRTFFERLAADGHRSSWSSRTSTRPTRACSTSSTTCSSGAGACRSSSSPSPGRSSSSGGPTGARAGAASRRASTWSRCRSPPCASSSAASCPGSPRPAVAGDRRARRRGPAVRGRDGPDAPRRGQARARATASTGRSAISRRSPCRRRSPRSSPPGSTPSSRPTGPSSCDAAVLGQSFTLAGPRRGERASTSRSSSRACGRSSGASSSTVEADPRSPERGQYAFVQALVREVAYNTLAQARPEGPPPRRRPLLREPRDRRARRRPRRPLPRRLPERARGRGGRRRRRPGPHRPAGGCRAGRRAWAPTRRPSRSSSRRSA